MKKNCILVVCALAVAVPLLTLAQGKPPPKPKRTRLSLEVRRAAIGPAASGELRLVPTFNCISVAYGTPEPVAELVLGRSRSIRRRPVIRS